MRSILICLILLITRPCFGQELYQLAPPMVKYSSAFFQKSIAITAVFDQPGTKIVYTTDGSIPGINSPVYNSPLVIKKNTHLQIRSVGKGFEPSPIVAAFFYKEGIPIRQINFSTPNPKYSTQNKNVLNDNIGGIKDVNSGNWLGYMRDSADFIIDLYKKEKIKSLFAHFLQNQGSWIFLPEKLVISLWDTSSNRWKELTTKAYTFSEAGNSDPHCCKIDLPFAVSGTKLKITTYPLQSIPGWHPGNGKPAWFFIDEIKLY